MAAKVLDCRIAFNERLEELGVGLQIRGDYETQEDHYVVGCALIVEHPLERLVRLFFFQELELINKLPSVRVSHHKQ